MNNAKMVKTIKMPFRLWTRVGQRNHVLDGDPIQIALCEGAIFRERTCPGMSDDTLKGGKLH